MVKIDDSRFKRDKLKREITDFIETQHIKNAVKEAAVFSFSGNYFFDDKLYLLINVRDIGCKSQIVSLAKQIEKKFRIEVTVQI